MTRAIIAKLPTWVGSFAARLNPPELVEYAPSSARWEHATKDAETLQVAKAVRIASGLRASMALADLRHTVECSTLLRTVSDFSSEITLVGEGLLENRLTAEQELFIAQQYEPLPSTPEMLASREKERPVGRGAIGKAQGRMADKAGYDKEVFGKIARYLDTAGDKYVHGHYITAMELYTGRTMTFLMAGHESEWHVCMSKASVAGKLGDALNALRFMAMTRGMPELATEIAGAFDSLMKSGEAEGHSCRGLV